MKHYAPAAERNGKPIADELAKILPPTGTALEIASGTGQHAVYFAQRFPGLSWIPSDCDADMLDSIRSWRETSELKNLQPPKFIDVRDDHWPVESADVIVNINMIHISPWTSCIGLLDGVVRTISLEGLLFLYGPYRIAGQPTAPSNESFDASLRARNPAWGLRQTDRVITEAANRGLRLIRQANMPANNLSLVFRRDQALG